MERAGTVVTTQGTCSPLGQYQGEGGQTGYLCCEGPSRGGVAGSRPALSAPRAEYFRARPRILEVIVRWRCTLAGGISLTIDGGTEAAVFLRSCCWSFRPEWRRDRGPLDRPLQDAASFGFPDSGRRSRPRAGGTRQGARESAVEKHETPGPAPLRISIRVPIWAARTGDRLAAPPARGDGRGPFTIGHYPCGYKAGGRRSPGSRLRCSISPRSVPGRASSGAGHVRRGLRLPQRVVGTLGKGGWDCGALHGAVSPKRSTSSFCRRAAFTGPPYDLRKGRIYKRWGQELADPVGAASSAGIEQGPKSSAVRLEGKHFGKRNHGPPARTRQDRNSASSSSCLSGCSVSRELAGISAEGLANLSDIPAAGRRQMRAEDSAPSHRRRRGNERLHSCSALGRRWWRALVFVRTQPSYLVPLFTKTENGIHPVAPFGGSMLAVGHLHSWPGPSGFEI